jgi:alcohol dehydrogenase (cytochrome c)
LFYVNATRAYSVYYVYDSTDRPAGWGGTDRGGWSESMLEAIDYQTGKIRWTHAWESGTRSGLLSTAGNVIFTGGSGGLEALDATTGETLWLSRLGATVGNGPITFELDDLQHVVAAAGNSMFSFVLNR